MSLLIKRNGNTFPSLVSDFFDNDKFFKPEFFGFGKNFMKDANMPSVNITEDEKNFSIELAAPGLAKKDFKIETEDGVLTVSAEKEQESKEEKKNYYRKEFSYNSFSRSFQLPENSLPEKIDAKYEDGVLKMVLPKKEVTKAQPKKEIKVA